MREEAPPVPPDLREGSELKTEAKFLLQEMDEKWRKREGWQQSKILEILFNRCK